MLPNSEGLVCPKMRVLYMANSEAIGGGNESLLAAIKALSSSGVAATVVCPTPGRMVDRCHAMGVMCHVVEYDWLRWRRPCMSLRAFSTWNALIRQVRPDLVHANGSRGARAIALVAWQARLPVVCHCRYGKDWRTYCAVYRGVFKKPDAVIFNSHALRRRVGEGFRRRCPLARQHVIYNAVDVHAFRAMGTQKSGTPRVGIIGNVRPVKGHEDFLLMAGQLGLRGIDAEYWIIGDCECDRSYYERLTRLVQSLGLGCRVKFCGFRADVANVLQQLDILVCSSHYETFGRCLIEAMACELAVVATRVGGIPEVVQHGETGLLVPPESPGALADAVEELLRNPRRRKEFGLAGRRRVEALFTTESHALQLLGVYKSLLGSD
jgi:glycosyltransferase involved in cell wall biosynthesis